MMKLALLWFSTALVTGLLTVGLVAVSPFLILHTLWSGNTKLIDSINNQIQDCYYIIGKSARKFLARQ